MTTELRRADYDQIQKLISRIERLEAQFVSLRTDFDTSEIEKSTKFVSLQTELTAVRVILEQLLKDVQEPIEAYKTAKAGYTFVKFLSEAARWLVPIITGLWVGGYFK